MSSTLYRYFYRKGFGTDEMLIEIRQGAEKEEFLKDFLQAIRSLHSVFNEIFDLWQNDEVIYKFSSNEGDFIVSKDVWGFAFVMAENNQPVLATIHELLQADEKFSQMDAATIKRKE